MAPTASTTEPLQDRLLKLAQTYVNTAKCNDVQPKPTHPNTD